ncbi:putative holliday junction resolvase [Verrucomicrobium sp. GAS474]|uniref:Holliday junction resolvase RuvX n=1 Tax=Verrucomicrobium sp. GAS474 TaxID=1882831 RepID=UPI00087ACE2B|nr:Holliday junction resolvase RuvX [Verrucomicrobium sp. GAS474]SDU00553.1 putative holliday junction resolvase [Verrucomicrobium sp. GAS474]
MSVLALDYGTKRIGVAVSDTTRSLARPLPFLPAEPFGALVKALRGIVAEHKVETIVVGMPRNMDGSYGEAAQKVRAFIAHLARTIVTPIQTVDERLSTVQAGRYLHEAGHKAKDQRTKIDSASAAVLLQAYLDRLTVHPGIEDAGPDLESPEHD